jgi:microcystin-dependent protein
MSLTTNKGIDIIAIGSPNWGEPVNDNSDIIDKALGSFETVTGTSGSITLTTAQYQAMCLKSGTAAFLADVTFVIPSDVAGQWVVINQSAASSFELRIKNAASADFLSIYSGETITVYSDGTTVFLLSEQPIAGAVMMFARNTAPTGWLKANGAAVSRATYAALFAAIGTTFGVGNGTTTFNVPELRGEFLRSWADGRSVDTGRAFGSAQADAFQGHFHRLRIDSSGQSIDFETVNASSGSGRRAAGTGSGVNVQEALTDGTNGTPRVASETRPRNVALLACIKY